MVIEETKVLFHIMLIGGQDMLWWNERLVTGVEEIDMQHKNIFSQLDKVLDLNHTTCKEEIESTLNFLIDYVVGHFGDEEALMIRNQYGQFEQHRDQHTYLMKQVYQFNKQFQGEVISEELLDDFKFLFIEWFADHIHKDDQCFAYFLQEKNVPIIVKEV